MNMFKTKLLLKGICKNKTVLSMFEQTDYIHNFRNGRQNILNT